MTVSIINIQTKKVIAIAEYKSESWANKWFDTISRIKNLDKSKYLFKIKY